MQSPITFTEHYFRSRDEAWVTIPSVRLDSDTIAFIMDPETVATGRRLARYWRECVHGAAEDLEGKCPASSKLEVIGLWIADVPEDSPDGSEQLIPIPPHAIMHVPDIAEGFPPMPAAWVRIHADIGDPEPIQTIDGAWFPLFAGVDQATAAFILHETFTRQISDRPPTFLRFCNRESDDGLIRIDGEEVPIEDLYEPCSALVNERGGMVGVRLSEATDEEIGFDLYFPFHESLGDHFDTHDVIDNIKDGEYWDQLSVIVDQWEAENKRGPGQRSPFAHLVPDVKRMHGEGRTPKAIHSDLEAKGETITLKTIKNWITGQWPKDHP